MRSLFQRLDVDHSGTLEPEDGPDRPLTGGVRGGRCGGGWQGVGCLFFHLHKNMYFSFVGVQENLSLLEIRIIFTIGLMQMDGMLLLVFYHFVFFFSESLFVVFVLVCSLFFVGFVGSAVVVGVL